MFHVFKVSGKKNDLSSRKTSICLFYLEMYCWGKFLSRWKFNIVQRLHLIFFWSMKSNIFICFFLLFLSMCVCVCFDKIYLASTICLSSFLPWLYFIFQKFSLRFIMIIILEYKIEFIFNTESIHSCFRYVNKSARSDGQI